MIVVSVMYARSERFDLDYYLTSHMPMVRARWAGLVTDTRVLKGVEAPAGGPAADGIVAEVCFPGMAEVRQALGGPHAAEIMADVSNFTDVQPVLQISEVVG